jgi:hypothetical protein
MGKMYSIYGGHKKWYYWLETLRRTDLLGDWDRHSLENNIEIDIREIGCEDVNHIELAEDYV